MNGASIDTTVLIILDARRDGKTDEQIQKLIKSGIPAHSYEQEVVKSIRDLFNNHLSGMRSVSPATLMECLPHYIQATNLRVPDFDGDTVAKIATKISEARISLDVQSIENLAALVNASPLLTLYTMRKRKMNIEGLVWTIAEEKEQTFEEWRDAIAKYSPPTDKPSRPLEASEVQDSYPARKGPRPRAQKITDSIAKELSEPTYESSKKTRSPSVNKQAIAPAKAAEAPSTTKPKEPEYKPVRWKITDKRESWMVVEERAPYRFNISPDAGRPLEFRLSPAMQELQRTNPAFPDVLANYQAAFEHLQDTRYQQAQREAIEREQRQATRRLAARSYIADAGTRLQQKKF